MKEYLKPVIEFIDFTTEDMATGITNNSAAGDDDGNGDGDL